MKGKILVLSGPGGAGKNTIIDHLLATFSGKITDVITATTRPMREGEQDGIDYYFLSQDEFEQKVHNQEFIEFEEVTTQKWYGTLKQPFQDIIDQGKLGITDVEVHGALKIKQFFGDNIELIFLKTPTLEVLEHRLRERNQDPENVIKQRLLRAEYELTYEHLYDRVVINDNLEDTYRIFDQIVSNYLSDLKSGPKIDEG